MYVYVSVSGTELKGGGVKARSSSPFLGGEPSRIARQLISRRRRHGNGTGVPGGASLWSRFALAEKVRIEGRKLENKGAGAGGGGGPSLGPVLHKLGSRRGPRTGRAQNQFSENYLLTF
jgi:hypothetical protein